MEALVVFVFAWLFIAVAVAAHAGSVGRSALAWGLVTFFFGVFALVAYLALLVTADDRDESGSVRVCPNCETEHAGTPKFCSECGERLATDDDTESEYDAATASILRSGERGYCGNCKTRVALDADRCDGCGAVF